MKILFVSSQNRLRSLTAETAFDGAGGHQVRAAGPEPGARIRVTARHLGWADIVFVMEKRHMARLQQKFRDALKGKRIICLYLHPVWQTLTVTLSLRMRHAEDFKWTLTLPFPTQR